MVREHLSRRQSIDSGNRNLLRLLFVTCGYSEVRSLSTPRIEMWLQNAKVYTLIFYAYGISHPTFSISIHLIEINQSKSINIHIISAYEACPGLAVIDLYEL